MKVRIINVDGKYRGDKFLEIAYGIKIGDIIDVIMITSDIRSRAKSKNLWYHIMARHRNEILAGNLLGKSTIIRIESINCVHEYRTKC